MYGYVRIDKNMLGCDSTRRYYAHLCGLCKISKTRHGQLSRFLCNYDTTFLDIFLHGIYGERTEIQEKKCLASRKKRAMTTRTSLSELVTDAGVLLGWYKLTDNITDKEGIKYRLYRWGIRHAYKRAKKSHPWLEAEIKAAYERLRICERDKEGNIDAVSHHFGTILSAVASAALTEQKQKNSTETERHAVKELFYNLGKWIYILDAVDDMEKDIKSGNYNPLYYGGDYDSAAFSLGCHVARIAECYRLLTVTDGKEILDNIVYFGLGLRSAEILNKIKREGEIA
jgi:hypothetical protein